VNLKSVFDFITMSTYHLDDQSTFRLVCGVLDVHLASFNGGVSAPCVNDTSLEDGDESLI